MTDILKSAQAQIDDAAGQIGASPTSPASPPPLPKLNLPFSSRADPHATQKEPTLIENVPLEPLLIPVIPPAVKKKHGNKFLLLAVLLFLFATLPLAAFFISQQSQLADLRGRAAQVPGPYPTCTTPNVCVPSAKECKDGGGRQVDYTCASGKIGVCCYFPIPTPSACSKTCVPSQLECKDGGGKSIAGTCSSGRFCCDFSAANTPTPTPGRGPINTPTPTSTSGSCGNAGQACCDPISHSGTICNGSLFCNTATWTCQTGAPPNLCQGSQGSGGTAGTQCEVFRCGSKCNAGNQCTISAGKVPCDQATLSGQCGQIDWLDTRGNYCGVKSQNCGGSCAGSAVPTATPGSGNPTPTPTPGGGNPTPTPTPIPGGTCEAIRIYNVDNTDITQAVKDGTKKLSLGEQIILATPIGSATKAHFRIQGVADWTENDPTETTDTEYRLTITIPTTLTQAQGTFEAEVFVDGQWK